MYNIRKFVTHIYKYSGDILVNIYTKDLYYHIYYDEHHLHDYVRLEDNTVDVYNDYTLIKDSTISKNRRGKHKRWNLKNNNLILECGCSRVTINNNNICIEFDIYAIVKMIEDKILTF